MAYFWNLNPSLIFFSFMPLSIIFKYIVSLFSSYIGNLFWLLILLILVWSDSLFWIQNFVNKLKRFQLFLVCREPALVFRENDIKISNRLETELQQKPPDSKVFATSCPSLTFNDKLFWWHISVAVNETQKWFCNHQLGFCK